MRNSMKCRTRYPALLVAFLLLLPGAAFAEKTFGGLTFVGDRQGVCIEIKGECVTEDILFELNTCDVNNEVKEKFKERMPFTLLVPIGSHNLLIKKNGENVASDIITISPEEVLEYKLP